MVLFIGRVPLVDLTTLARGVLLRLGARHPRSTAVLGSGVLGLDALVSHDPYDTCCLRMTRKNFGKTISGIRDRVLAEAIALCGDEG